MFTQPSWYFHKILMSTLKAMATLVCGKHHLWYVWSGFVGRLPCYHQICLEIWDLTNNGIPHEIFFHLLGISSSQLTNSIIFQRGRAQPPTTSESVCFWGFHVFQKPLLFHCEPDVASQDPHWSCFVKNPMDPSGGLRFAVGSSKSPRNPGSILDLFGSLFGGT